MTRAFVWALPAVFVTALSAPAFAQSLDAHEHGAVSVNIVQDGAMLFIELEAPGADIVGFEHKARTDEQIEAVAAAAERLTDGGALFIPSADAACSLSEASVDTAGYDADKPKDDHAHGHSHARDDSHDHGHDKEAKAEQGHSHGHDHDHGHDDDHGSHAEFRAAYSFTCGSPDALQAVDIALFESFPSVHEVRVQAVGPAGQRAATLKAGSARFSLQ